MAKTLPIYLYGQPVLRNMSEDITPDYPNLSELIADMWQTMYESDGIGLAAPQIGRNIRLQVIDATPIAEEYPECAQLKLVMINAHMRSLSEETCSEAEGCLSLPGINERVVRPESIVVDYMNEQFEPQHLELSGYAARVVQHEYDHLDGKLFVDHISAMRKRLIKKKLQHIADGRVRVGYPVMRHPIH